MTTSVLRNGRIADGRLVDIVCVDGLVTTVAPAGSAVPASISVDAEIHDLAGLLVMPAATEPHAHIDKAFTADRSVNQTGDLMGAVTAARSHHHTLTVADMEARAERAAMMSLANGITVIRTHVDLSPSIGLKAVEAVVNVRERLRGLIDIQIVPLVSAPTTGASGAEARARQREAHDMGADVVGGCPHFEDDPPAAIDAFVELAASRNLLIDLHVDETLDPTVLTLRDYARLVRSYGWENKATASHCVSLSMQTAELQAVIADEVAVAGISIVVNPQTNLFLQSRGITTAPPRGLAPISVLRSAGVNVAGGADNLQDPFNTVGRADPMETAALLVMAGHLAADDAYELVSDTARRALGLRPVALTPGSPADFLAIDAVNVREAVASASGTRNVFKGGRLVSSSVRTIEFCSPHAIPGVR
ncbi:MAG: amidohydrolase family protein [Acidimicrobiia bacterium]